MPSGFFRRCFAPPQLGILAGLLFLLPFVSRAQGDELRAYWADAFASGFHTAAQVDVTNTNGVFEFTDPETNVPLRFYRAKPGPRK